MNQVRKLSTILFASIANYKSFIQSNEEKALVALNHFNSAIEKVSRANSGQIIKNFGDSALLSFDSTTDGGKCANDLQNIALKEIDIPITIGMHLGEVVFKDDNAFGDGVNIASRLESIAVEGSLLISRAIRDQIKNKPEFRLKSLGSLEFKNIEDPVDVFALANKDLNIPSRKNITGKLKDKKLKKRPFWQLPALIVISVIFAVIFWFYDAKLHEESNTLKGIHDSTVAVLPFENQTGDENLEFFGLMSMDWISQGLLETGEARVIKEDPNVLISSLAENPNYVPERTSNIIRGRFYNEGENNLVMMAELVDASTKSVLFSTKPCSASKDNLMGLLESVQQELLGFWVTKNKIVGKRPPKYDAYQEYVIGKKLHPGDWTSRIKHFNKSFKLDSSFTKPLFELMVIGRQYASPEITISAIEKLEELKGNFTEYERLRYESYNSFTEGNYALYAELFWELYMKFNQISDARIAINQFRDANYLSKCKELFPVIQEKEALTFDNIDQQMILVSYVNYFLQNEKYDSTILLIEQLETELITAFLAIYHIRAYTRSGQMEKVDSLLNLYEKKNLQAGGYYTPPTVTLDNLY